MTDPKERLEATLRAVGGVEGIKRCLAIGNDAPLLILIDEARKIVSSVDAVFLQNDHECPYCKRAWENLT